MSLVNRTLRYHVFERCKHLTAIRGSTELTQESYFIRFKLCRTSEKNITKGYSPTQDDVVESEDEPHEVSDSAPAHNCSMMRLRRSPDSNGNTVNPFRDWQPVNPILPVYDASGDQVGFTQEDAAHAAFLQTCEGSFNDAYASFLQTCEERHVSGIVCPQIRASCS